MRKQTATVHGGGKTRNPFCKHLYAADVATGGLITACFFLSTILRNCLENDRRRLSVLSPGRVIPAKLFHEGTCCLLLQILSDTAQVFFISHIRFYALPHTPSQSHLLSSMCLHYRHPTELQSHEIPHAPQHANTGCSTLKAASCCYDTVSSRMFAGN